MSTKSNNTPKLKGDLIEKIHWHVLIVGNTVKILRVTFDFMYTSERSLAMYTRRYTGTLIRIPKTEHILMAGSNNI